MRYPIDFKDRFEETLLFWMERFVRNKVTTLSNHQVKERKRLDTVLLKLTRGITNIEELKWCGKEARNAGLIGINTYVNPLIKLYERLSYLGLASMKEIDEEMLSDYLVIATSGLSDASKKNHRIALLSFFSYIDKQNQDDQGNSHLFRIELKNWGGLRGKSGEKLPAYMNEKELERFLEALDSYEFSLDIRARNRLVIKLILYTGIRVSEALGLRLKDFLPDQDSYLLKIRGKGNKERMVMVKKEPIQKELDEWLGVRQSLNAQEDWLFCNQKGGRLTQAYVSRIVEQILLWAGIRKEKNGAHMLRHSFATLLYQKKRDLVLVQEALGHADLNTSRIYTHFDRERLREAASLMDDLTPKKKEN
ncbi:MAG: tyrosine-type recombinase/integrase [Wolinella succinogenes]|uniref:tyrosine-type recombinase/integrase n=1 Tax=Wolinella succinogenes TaxID=844 RepID=UPI0016BCAFC5|nr:tyrosine-type recombinase/integrase [Wolinella succinogenes]NLU34998.1 tyrosine-type recombinase/integrase [Wolinella succinogenes]